MILAKISVEFNKAKFATNDIGVKFEVEIYKFERKTIRRSIAR
ncbi:hypothetical protein [Campylobacter showae]|nr:hypothetical protein [Campylobacter showae]